MLRIAIVDDEPSVVDEIRQIVISFFQAQGKQIDISCFSSGEEIISYEKCSLSHHRPMVFNSFYSVSVFLRFSRFFCSSATSLEI